MHFKYLNRNWRISASETEPKLTTQYQENYSQTL